MTGFRRCHLPHLLAGTAIIPAEARVLPSLSVTSGCHRPQSPGLSSDLTEIFFLNEAGRVLGSAWVRVSLDRSHGSQAPGQMGMPDRSSAVQTGSLWEMDSRPCEVIPLVCLEQRWGGPACQDSH